jgi:DNA polymerase III subunit gamma/tau
MSYLVLARKYRPQTFEQVIQQEHVTRTLAYAVSSGRVAHAILFSGPRGTGKTTVARILARAMNCGEGPTPVPCNICRSCSEIAAGGAADVFEIDGASNNSVDQIRELRENVRYMPAHSRYKIYIIDEVHMLSIAAFNALLKTLEEPPPHVLFFFATTEPGKIPMTILSRCQRYDLRRVEAAALTDHLRSICAKEGVAIPEESLAQIARETGGSIRDALSLLDQVINGCGGEGISHAEVLDILGVVDRKIIFEIASAVLRSDIPAFLEIMDDAYDRGHDMKRLYGDLLEHFRNLMVVVMVKKPESLIDLSPGEIDRLRDQAGSSSPALLSRIFDTLLKEESAVRVSGYPRLVLEMTVIRMMQLKPALPIDLLIEKLDLLRKEIGSPQPAGVSESIPPYGGAEPPSPSAVAFEGPPPLPVAENRVGSEEGLEGIREKILAAVSETNPSLAVNLSKSTVKRVSGKTVEIEINGNGFNLAIVNQTKNQEILREICSRLFGEKMRVTVTANVCPEPTENRPLPRTGNDKAVIDAIDILKGRIEAVHQLGDRKCDG